MYLHCGALAEHTEPPDLTPDVYQTKPCWLKCLYLLAQCGPKVTGNLLPSYPVLMGSELGTFLYKQPENEYSEFAGPALSAATLLVQQMSVVV